MESLDIKSAAMLALIGVVTALLSGKLVRRLLLLPFEYLSRNSANKIDDKLVDEARHDLGVDSPTLPAESEEKK